MTQLVLVSGFKDEAGANSKRLKDYIESSFPSYREVWMDPEKKPRAVIFFDEQLELKDFQKTCKGTEMCRYLEAVEQTHSVFVETYDCMEFGVKDKLKYLFTSCRHGGSPVLHVEHLNFDYYEIVFNSWDDVLKTCKQPWVVEKQTLCVTPYFECFKEPFEAQMQRLIKLNSATRQIKAGSSSYTPPKRSVNLSSGVGNLINAPIKPLPRQPSLTELKLTEAAQHLTKGSPENQQNLSKSPGLYNPFSDSGASKAAETNISAVKQSCFPVERRADQKSAKPILEHPYILILLHLLNFEKAVQAHFDSTAVIIDTATSEIEITGPLSSVKIIQKFLTEKDEMEQGEVVVKFLANEAVHQDLKAYVYAEKLHVVINVKDKLSFEVQYGNNRTVSFDEFITSLVVTKECSPLPNEQSKKNIKWIEFMESFQKAYSHQHIFFKDTCVTLVSLAHMSQDIDVVSNIINNEIVQLNRDLHSGPTSEPSTAKTTNSVDETLGDGLTATSSSNSSEDTQSLQTNPLFRTITIFSQNCTLLWLLNVLNFRNAVKQLDSNLTVDIIENEQEITINGPRKYVHNLKSIIMTVNKQFPLTVSLQELLSEAHIQEYLRACFNESKCHIVLNENSEMLVAYTNEEKEQRTTYLINLIEIRECACLPEKYHITEEWNSLVPSVKNSQPYVYVFTANDKAYVLLVAIRETLPDINLIVRDINSAISFLTSTPEEQVETKPALTPTSKEKFETKPALTPTSKEKFETKPTWTPTSKEKFETKPTLTSKEKFETKPTLTSTLEEKPETKLALTSTLEEMVVDACSSDPLKDPTSTLNNIVKDKVQSSSHVIPEPAENAKKLKLRIIFKHPVLPWILDVLRLNKAVGEIGVFVNTDSETEISIRGPRDVVQGLQKTLITQDNQMPFEDQCDEILSDVQVQQFLLLRLENLKARIVLGDNLDLCTEIRSGEKTSLKNFFANFIHFQRCSNLPEMFHNTEQWEELVKKYQNHEFCCVLVRNYEVHLLTCALGQRSCDTDIIVQEINETISSFTSSVSHDFEMIEEPENHDIFFEYPEKKKLYCEKFLQKEILKIFEPYKSYDAGIAYVANGFRIHSTSQEMTHRLTNEIKEMLSTIIEKFRSLKFPCLDKFMKSAGSGLIETLSHEHKCQIEVSNSNGSNPRSLSTSGNMFPESSQRHEYTVTVLETAKCNGFNVHLVQGDMQDINVGMRVGFQSSDEVDVCDVKTVKSSKNVVIRLPRWYVANEISHLDNLRSSFQDTVKLTLEQAGHLKVSTMAFSMERLSYAKDYSFLADVIAKIIVEKLIQHFGFDPVTSKKTYMQDIYICGKMNKAIFRAFTFFLKRRGAFIGPPNQASWDKVCPQESEEYSSYNSLKAKGLDIEVSSDFPSHKGKNACFFYPIQPTLETVSCPAMKDNHFQDGGLRTFLHEQEKQNPDGLLPTELFSVKGHQTGRLAFIYISPEWGMYSKQTIEWILGECIRFASDYEEVYIVPPGMQIPSKYPVAYLAQTWFKHLDRLLLSPTFHVQKKKITFIVLEHSYKKAFEQELEKRLPRDHETGIIGKLWNYITGSDKENDNQKNVPQSTTKVSRMPDTMVSFWCTGYQDFQKASMQLEKKLKELMAKNTKEVHLDKTETQNVQLLMKDLREACALITFTETYKMKKKKKKNKLTGSILKLQGLCMDCVNNCLHILHLGSKITGKAKCNEETDMDMSVESNGNSSIPMETHSQPQQDDKLPPLKAAPIDASSHSLTQMTSSFKWQYDANCNGQFGDIGSIENDIEVAYSEEDKEFFNPPGGKFIKINFTTMTAVSKTNEKSIIRTEVFEKPQKDVHFPDSWSSMSTRKFAIEELENEEFQRFQRQLEECLNANKLLLKQVSQVQNKTLYTRYSQKTSQLKVKDPTTLWHKASNTCSDQICGFGFHPRFSGMPKAKHLGDGVLFYKEPDRCLSQPIKAEGKEVYLFMSRVLLGRCGPGRQGLRCPPSDESTGQPFNSVHGEDEAYMIFSDAQAYPEYMLTLERA